MTAKTYMSAPLAWFKHTSPSNLEHAFRFDPLTSALDLAASRRLGADLDQLAIQLAHDPGVTKFAP